MKFKFEPGDREVTEKAVPDAPNWLDKHRLAENEDEMTRLVKTN